MLILLATNFEYFFHHIVFSDVEKNVENLMIGKSFFDAVEVPLDFLGMEPCYLGDRLLEGMNVPQPPGLQCMPAFLIQGLHSKPSATRGKRGGKNRREMSRKTARKSRPHEEIPEIAGTEGEEMIAKSAASDHSSAPIAMKANGNYNDEVWAKRLQHRTEGRSAVKRSMDYNLLKFNDMRPSTPDPQDRRVSKRVWEQKVQKWRLDMRTITQEMHWVYVLQAVLKDFLSKETN